MFKCSKKSSTSITIISCCCFLFINCSKTTKNLEFPNAPTAGPLSIQNNLLQNLSVSPKLGLKIKNGTLVIELYPQKAPKTIEVILQMMASGFYSRLTFHRVVDNFIIQTGELSDITSSTVAPIPLEENDLIHVKGSVSLATNNANVNLPPQFFISLGTFPHLDGHFTVFGKVIEGLNHLETIRIGDPIFDVSLIK